MVESLESALASAGFSAGIVASTTSHFAAAISTLDSTLAESADLTVRHIYEKFIQTGQSEAHYLRASRVIVALWGLAFFGVTLVFARFADQGLLDLTFKLPGYVTGVVLATIVLARFGIGGIKSFLAGILVACVVVYLMQDLGIAFLYWCPASGIAMLTTVWLFDRKRPDLEGLVNV